MSPHIRFSWMMKNLQNLQNDYRKIKLEISKMQPGYAKNAHKRVRELEAPNVDLLLWLYSLKVDLQNKKQRREEAIVENEVSKKVLKERSVAKDRLTLENQQLNILVDCNSKSLKKVEAKIESH